MYIQKKKKNTYKRAVRYSLGIYLRNNSRLRNFRTNFRKSFPNDDRDQIIASGIASNNSLVGTLSRSNDRDVETYARQNSRVRISIVKEIVEEPKNYHARVPVRHR